MSFQGINFANQRLLPSDDGRLYQNIFNDGALYGCGITYSGTELTISQGHLVIGGRQIEIESAEVLDVNQAVSGFAQIVLAIDLTKTATISTFNQISIEVRYAAAEDGFSTLTQTDINGSGSYYEAQLALLSLGTGGITGIVQNMPQAAFKGAAEGGGLNLYVVGGTAQPENPKENTVWVNTDTEISGYAFSATEPENPVPDMVWIEIGVSSAAAFNVDKKNAVMLYPRLAKQYISGAWVTKEAKAFVDGMWKEIIKSLVLYSPGNTHDDITGGYKTYFRGGSSTIEFKADCIYIHAAWQNEAAVYTQNTFDLSDYSKLYARCGEQISVGITDPSTGETVTLGTGTENGINFDISAYTGAYQIRFFGNSTGNYTLTGNVYEARLEV